MNSVNPFLLLSILFLSAFNIKLLFYWMFFDSRNDLENYLSCQEVSFVDFIFQVFILGEQKRLSFLCSILIFNHTRGKELLGSK